MTEAHPEGRKNDDAKEAEPRGLGEHVRGLASEYAHEQGWGLNEEERTKVPEGRQDTDGGTNYNYGARDFGDEPTNLESPAIIPQRLSRQSNPKGTGAPARKLPNSDGLLTG